MKSNIKNLTSTSNPTYCHCNNIKYKAKNYTCNGNLRKGRKLIYGRGKNGTRRIYMYYSRSLFTKAYHPNLNDPASEMTYQNEERKEQNREKNNPE